MAAPQRKSGPNPREEVKRVMEQVKARQPFLLDPFFQSPPRSPVSPPVPQSKPVFPRKSDPMEIYTAQDYEWAGKPLKPRRKPSLDQHIRASQVPFEK